MKASRYPRQSLKVWILPNVSEELPVVEVPPLPSAPEPVSDLPPSPEVPTGFEGLPAVGESLPLPPANPWWGRFN